MQGSEKDNESQRGGQRKAVEQGDKCLDGRQRLKVGQHSGGRGVGLAVGESSVI